MCSHLTAPRIDFFKSRNKFNIENYRLTQAFEELKGRKKREGSAGFQSNQKGRSPKETDDPVCLQRWLGLYSGGSLEALYTQSSLTPDLSYTEFGECNFLGFSSFMGELRRVWVVLSTIR